MVIKIMDQLDNRLKIVDKPFVNKPYKKYEQKVTSQKNAGYGNKQQIP